MSKNIVLPKHPLFKNHTGKRFGRLTVLSYAGRLQKYRISSWLCQCDCGERRIVTASALQQGTESCGCLQREVTSKSLRTHGETGSVQHRAWARMIQRCENETDGSYHNYGGRGIRVCARWRNSFENFLRDIGRRPPDKYSIERLDNNGNYEPGNCVWADRTQQARNKRSNHLITFQGKTLCVSEWAELTGLPNYTIEKRLRVDRWTVERALTTPKRIVSKARA